MADSDTDAANDQTEDESRRISSDRYFLYVIAGLVAVAAAAFAAGLAVGDDSDDEPDGFAHELEAWSECLAENGAVVPDFDADDDGGFTLEFEPGFFDGFEFDRFARATEACEDVLPLGELIEALGVPHELLLDLDRDFDQRDARERKGRDVPQNDDEFAVHEFIEELRGMDERDLGELRDDLPPGRLRQICHSLTDIDVDVLEEGVLERVRFLCDFER